MQRFEGDRVLAVPPAELFARLTDARFLVKCVPDVESVTLAEERRAVLVLRPGFAFVRGTLEVHLEVVDVAPPEGARVVIRSKGIGSSADVKATLALAPEGAGTKVHWVAEVTSLGGLLKLVPGGLIRGAAEKVINDAWDRVTRELQAPSQESK
jgi:uncharacterized protein